MVITSVDRDDLKDGGVKHFVKTIKCIRKTSPNTTIEVLTPDFIKNNTELMKKIIEIKDAEIEDGGSGAFYIFLKKKL